MAIVIWLFSAISFVQTFLSNLSIFYLVLSPYICDQLSTNQASFCSTCYNFFLYTHLHISCLIPSVIFLNLVCSLLHIDINLSCRVISGNALSPLVCKRKKISSATKCNLTRGLIYRPEIFCLVFESKRTETAFRSR